MDDRRRLGWARLLPIEITNTILVKIVSFKDHPVATRGRSAGSR